jgi:hypothetical protein
MTAITDCCEESINSFQKLESCKDTQQGTIRSALRISQHPLGGPACGRQQTPTMASENVMVPTLLP